MKQHIEKSLILPGVTIQLAVFHWQGVEDVPEYTGYGLSQRLSDDHSPLRIGNLSPPQVLPRVRSVGLLPPGHTIRMFPLEKPLRVIYCVFDEAYFETVTGVERARWEAQTDALVAIKSQRLEILMQEIYAELEAPDFGQQMLIEAITKLILVELARYLRQLEHKGTRSGNTLALAPLQLRRIQERIAVSATAGYPSLAELAELCGFSQGHLARAFKAATGWQLHKYIAEERLKLAKTLLLEGQLSCEAVSMQLGFKSPAYFSTVFRRATGKTPTEYRRLAQSGREDSNSR